MTRRLRTFLLPTGLLLAGITAQLAANSPPAATTSPVPNAARVALEAADHAYNQAAKVRDREGFHALLSADAVFLADTPKRGRIDYIASWTPLFEGKHDFRYLGRSLETTVARSSDLGWTLGHAETSFVRPGSQERSVISSQYMTVWTKASEAGWKVVASATLVVHPELGAARDPRSGLMTAWPELADQIDAAIKLEWTPEHTVRAASGELAYTLGTFRAEFKRGGTLLAGDGAYLAVWEKDEEGHWQLAAEGFTPPTLQNP